MMMRNPTKMRIKKTSLSAWNVIKYEAIIHILNARAMKISLSFIKGFVREKKKVKMTTTRARMMNSFCVPGIV
jgi:hypothetical protein